MNSFSLDSKLDFFCGLAFVSLLNGDFITGFASCMTLYAYHSTYINETEGSAVVYNNVYLKAYTPGRTLGVSFVGLHLS